MDEIKDQAWVDRMKAKWGSVLDDLQPEVKPDIKVKNISQKIPSAPIHVWNGVGVAPMAGPSKLIFAMRALRAAEALDLAQEGDSEISDRMTPKTSTKATD